jgi:hypothetical protein
VKGKIKMDSKKREYSGHLFAGKDKNFQKSSLKALVKRYLINTIVNYKNTK